MIAHLVHAGERAATRALRSIIRPRFCQFATIRWLGAGLVLLLGTGQSAAVLTVAPSSISNSYNGEVTLTITGLNNPGQRVVVEKFLDMDDSSTITTADVLMQRFHLTDGQVTELAGTRNINVPGDDDGEADGAIQTALILTPGEIPSRIDGRYILRVSPDGAGFTPFTDTLTVTQQEYGGSGISGRVTDGAAPQAGAFVLITFGSPDDFEVRGATRTDVSGNFAFKVPAGDYRPVPVKPGFVFDLGSSSTFSVSAGNMTAAGDAVLTTGTRAISGQVRDSAAVPQPLGGMLIYGFGESGWFTFTFSSATGDYSLDALAGPSEIGALQTQCAMMGVISTDAEEAAGIGNVSGFHLTLPRAAALISGTVRTSTGSPLPWLDVIAENQGSNDMEGHSISDSSGNYTLAVIPGDWRVEVESPGYLSASRQVNIPAPGLEVPQDITANPITAHLRGTVRDSNNQAVPGVEILAHDFSGTSSWGVTDGTGNFDLGVHGGSGGAPKTWSLQLNQNDEDNPATHISSQAQFEVTDGADINGITYRVYLITSHLRGSVLDENNAAVGGVNLYAVQPGGDAVTGSNVEGDGTFDIPAFGGTWSIGISHPLPGGFLSQDNLQVSAVGGADVSGLVFRLRRTTGTVSGSVKNSGGTGLANLVVTAGAVIQGVSYSAFTHTEPDGNYSLPVCAGLWNVTVDANGLLGLGYQPVPAQQVSFTSGNVTVNFTATTGGTTFSSWQSQNFTPAELANSAISGPNADPERDGASNFLEYSLNLAPKIPDANGLPFTGRLPGAPGGGDFLTLTFRRRIGAQGLAYNALEAPSPAGPWTNVTAAYEVLSSDGTTESVRARTVITPAVPKFMRLQVIQQP
jgi:hypothetical protein